MSTHCLLASGLIFSIVIIGCNKTEDLNTAPPELPDTLLLDLNNDGVEDIWINYWGNDELTDGTLSFFGSFHSLNERLLILSRKNGLSAMLDHQLNDTIKILEPPSFYWESSSSKFISIDDSPPGVWPDEWTILSDKLSSPYYLGIRLKVNDDYSLGFLKLGIDKKTAKVDIMDQRMTSADYIVIDR